MQSPPLLLTVVIVSYNTRALTVDCVRTLCAQIHHLPYEVFVVDNGSTDDSVEAVREAFPQVELISNQTNRGFGAANNQALVRARGDYILLLNSDAFLKPRAVEILIDFLQRHPKVGIVGPRLLNSDGSRQRSCFHFPTPFRCWVENLGISKLLAEHPVLGSYHHGGSSEERSVDFVIGACMLVRREVYTLIGGFDERFFMYQEEADWQRRAQKRGWAVTFVPTAEAVHLGGASGASDPVRINRHFFESLDRYQLIHHGMSGFLLMRAAMVIGCLLRVVVWSMAAIWPPLRDKALRRIQWLCWLLFHQASRGLPVS